MGAYCRAYDVDLSEAAHHGVYASFDHFFTRPLKPGARPVAEDKLVSPADGKLSVSGSVSRQGQFTVKGNRYSTAELIGSSEDAEQYEGGSFAVVYLSPRDYHRVHSPVAGKVVEVRSIPGDLFPVNELGERYIPRLLVRNNRVSIVIDTPDMGRITVVMVGAIVVGRISVTAVPGPAPTPGVHVIDPPLPVAKGDEIGVFHLGSTAVLLTEPGITIVRTSGPVRYGESLLTS